MDCGENRPLRLEFDHVRGKKDFCISEGIRRRQCWSKILKEIDKCEVRCSNCHAEKTARDGNSFMWQMLESEKNRSLD